jgi:hypothetical protein
MRDVELVSGFSEWSLAHDVAMKAALKRQRSSLARKLRTGAELVGFVLLISLALPTAASLGILLGTGLAP